MNGLMLNVWVLEFSDRAFGFIVALGLGLMLVLGLVFRFFLRFSVWVKDLSGNIYC